MEVDCEKILLGNPRDQGETTGYSLVLVPKIAAYIKQLTVVLQLGPQNSDLLASICITSTLLFSIKYWPFF